MDKLSSYFVFLSILLYSSACNNPSDSKSEPVLTSIKLNAEKISFLFTDLDSTLEISATGFDQNNDVVENLDFTWSSSDENIASVTGQGMAVFKQAGEVQISASIENITGSISISALSEFKSGITSIVNVHVVDVENGVIVPNQDVVINEGKIELIQNTGTTPLPSGETIDGTGKYLSPGLADAHVHVTLETDFIKYLANGITSLLDMGNSSRNPPAVLEWKKKILTGDLDGPNFYPSILMRSPQFVNARFTVGTAAQAREAVQANKDYDFIKAYSFIPSDAFSALIDEGKKYNLAVMGHGNRNLGLASILSQGQVMIAHAEEYLYVHYNGINPSQTQEAIDLTLNAGAYIVATMSTYEAISLVWGKNEAGYNQLLARPGYEYLSQSYKSSWQNQYENTYNNPGSISANLTFQKQYVKQFHDAGIKFMFGTDSPGIVGQHAGFSIHYEIKTLIQAGISNSDILKIGSLNFGDFVKEHSRYKEDFGKIAEGFRADLVLLDTNPLVNLSTFKDPALVIVRGKVYTKEYLKTELEKLRN